MSLKVAQLSFWFLHADNFCDRALADREVELSAIWDDQPARAAEKAEQYGARNVADLEDLLADPVIDAVCICSEPSTHADLAVAAIRAGKHVLIEKPMASSVADAVRIVEAAEQHQVEVMCAYNLRFTPTAQYVHDVVTSGQLGEVTRVRLLHGHYDEMEAASYSWDALRPHWGDQKSERRDALFYAGSHGALWYEWMFGLPSRVVSFGKTTVPGLPVHDNSSVLLDYGAFVGTLEVSETLPLQATTCEIYGTKGAIIQFRGNLPSTRVNTGSLQTVGVFSVKDETWTFPLISPAFLRHEAAYNSVGQFFEALKSGSRVPSTAVAGLRSIQILEAADTSEQLSQIVPIEPVYGEGGSLLMSSGTVDD